MVALLRPSARTPDTTARTEMSPSVVPPPASDLAPPVAPPPAPPPGLRLVVDNGPVTPGRTRSLRVAESPGREPATSGSPGGSLVRAVLADSVAVVAVVFAALLVFGGLLFVRLSQGAPAADTWERLEQVSVNDRGDGAQAAGSGDGLITAKPGDSMWSIAERVAPGSDPRPVVAALIEANGGDSVQIGQQIVIPGKLLD